MKKMPERNYPITMKCDKEIPFRMLDEFPGSNLEFISYEQLLPYAQPESGKAFIVVCGDFVSTEERNRDCTYCTQFWSR